MNNDGVSNLENLVDDYELTKQYGEKVIEIESGNGNVYEVDDISEAFNMVTFKGIKKYILDNKLLTKEQAEEAEQIGRNKGKLEVLKSNKFNK